MTPAVALHINGLINAPWVRDGRNCWRLVREVVALLGCDLPVVLDVAPLGKSGRELKRELFNRHPERSNWREVDTPDRWAIALLHKQHRPADHVEHAGVYFPDDGGHVLHTADPHGVVFDNLHELRARGWAPIYLVPR
jgi:hypothetical protein